ncbi:MAG: ankyrin repeat domain-containing protein [Pedobacter sp.]|nr:MAG: ankyrin repeat domain-containing protein [Pedobacter sp.]
MKETLLESLIEANDFNGIKLHLTNNPQDALALTSHQISPVLLASYYQKPEIANLIAGFLPEIKLNEACALGLTTNVNLILQKNPALLNAHSDDGFTPLGLACHFNHSELANFLIQLGADPNLSSKNGYHVFPLHAATNHNNLTLAKLLFKHGAYPNVCQKLGMTPLHIAAQKGYIDLIILLLEHGGDISLRMEGGKLPADLAAQHGFQEIADILRDED